MITDAGFFPQIIARSSNGTLAAPTALTANSALLSLSARGHNGTVFTGDRAAINVSTTENWTNSANGTRMLFATTANGTASQVTRMTIAQDGNVGIGTTAPEARLDIRHEDSLPSLMITKARDFDFPSVAGSRMRGTLAAPTAIINQNTLLALTARGHTGTGFSLNNTASIFMTSTENWTDFANGTEMTFYTTANVTAVPRLRMSIGQDGTVDVVGTLTAGVKPFKIDHPLDPENKYLYHVAVESPDMKNIYDGNVTTDKLGEAEVTLPDWFGALNRDFRYQLTVIGQFSQAIVAEEIKANRFKIKTSLPNVKVSWQVTGIRQDAFANKHRIQVEQLKPAAERGTYLHPEAFNQPNQKGLYTRERLGEQN